MKRVLIVDDDPSIHLIVTAALERAGGIRITFAHNGEQALRRIQSMKPDLILLDINMPEISGDDVMYEIRKDPALRDTPVVFVTGIANAANFDYARFGAQGLIAKPFDPISLAEEISAYLPMDAPARPLLEAPVSRDSKAEQERLRAGFLRRAFQEIELLERFPDGAVDHDAARRIVCQWIERAEGYGHPSVVEVAQRICERIAAGGNERLASLLEKARNAFTFAQREEKWRLLDAEMAETNSASDAIRAERSGYCCARMAPNPAAARTSSTLLAVWRSSSSRAWTAARRSRYTPYTSTC